MCTCAAGHQVDCRDSECRCGLKPISEYVCKYPEANAGQCVNNNELCQACFNPKLCVYVGDADGN